MFLAFASGEPAQVNPMVLVIALLVAIPVYLFFCYCYKRICEKAGVDPGVMIWIPIVQMIPVFRAAGMNPWLILTMFIPLVNLIVIVLLFVNLCKALGKSPWLAVMLFIPFLNILLLPYLAFSESAAPKRAYA